MTEDEAKTKSCCGPRNNGSHGGDDDLLCVGSACMAWRWIAQDFHRPTELWSRSKNCRVNSAWSDDAWWRPVGETADQEPPPALGFCALAGSPR